MKDFVHTYPVYLLHFWNGELDYEDEDGIIFTVLEDDTVSLELHTFSVKFVLIK